MYKRTQVDRIFDEYRFENIFATLLVHMKTFLTFLFFIRNFVCRWRSRLTTADITYICYLTNMQIVNIICVQRNKK